jgi:hypothetical protein
MKKILYLLTILLIFPTVLAINLNVEKITKDEVMIIGLEDPAIFTLNVTNNGPTSDFTFYTFFGIGLEPRESIKIKSGETKEITLYVYPRSDSKLKGYTNFNYFIQAKDGSEIEDKLTLNLIDLEDAFEIGASSINPESNILEIYIHNKVNFNFEDVSAKFSSAFFDLEEDFSLGPKERKNFEISLNKKDFNSLMAGFYTLTANVNTKDLSADIEGKIKFEEKDLLETNTKKYGLIISTKLIQITNNGNVISESETILKKNIFSRLFTTFNPEPSIINREGLTIYYTWNNDVLPGEMFEITVRTNWILPFLVILLIVAIIIFTKKYSKTDLILRKKVSFVNAKGGEFALKVTIVVEAMKHLEKVIVSDRLPPLVKVYNRFAGEIPKRFHQTKKIFEWDFEELEQGERRILSYIIYSKVGVLGRFALPRTIARFKVEDQEKEVNSNKAYFLAEQKSEDFE